MCVSHQSVSLKWISELDELSVDATGQQSSSGSQVSHMTLRDGGSQSP